MKAHGLLLLLACGLVLLQGHGLAAETNSVWEFQKQVERLKAENEALKRENQLLRSLLSERQSGVASRAQPQARPADAVRVPSVSSQRPAPGSSAQPTSHWLTISSGKRHNSSCRYYGTTKGRPCGPNDGIPCKICGG